MFFNHIHRWVYYCILSTSVTRGLWEKKTRHNTRVGLEPTTSAILEQCCIKVFCFVFWRCNINYTVTLLRLCIPFRDYFPAWKQNLLWIFSDILYKFDYILNWNFQMLILLCICFKNQRKPFSWEKKRGEKNLSIVLTHPQKLYVFEIHSCSVYMP